MASKAKPTDTTGRIREEAQAQFIQEQQEASTRMAMATAQANADLANEVYDATEPNRPAVIVDEAIVVGKPESDTVEIRVVESIENMTYGANNFYSFEAGKKYTVSREIANHLRSKGYIAADF